MKFHKAFLAELPAFCTQKQTQQTCHSERSEESAFTAGADLLSEGKSRSFAALLRMTYLRGSHEIHKAFLAELPAFCTQKQTQQTCHSERSEESAFIAHADLRLLTQNKVMGCEKLLQTAPSLRFRARAACRALASAIDRFVSTSSASNFTCMAAILA